MNKHDTHVFSKCKKNRISSTKSKISILREKMSQETKIKWRWTQIHTNDPFYSEVHIFVNSFCVNKESHRCNSEISDFSKRVKDKSFVLPWNLRLHPPQYPICSGFFHCGFVINVISEGIPFIGPWPVGVSQPRLSKLVPPITQADVDG